MLFFFYYDPVSGYSAIIIHNMNSNQAMSMGGGDHVVNIPVVSIGEFDAIDLRGYNYNTSPLFTILITCKSHPVGRKVEALLTRGLTDGRTRPLIHSVKCFLRH